MIYAIEADEEFMHPNELVIQAVWHYHIAIKYLLNHPKDKDRAKNAFEIVYEHSKIHSTEEIKKKGKIAKESI